MFWLNGEVDDLLEQAVAEHSAHTDGKASKRDNDGDYGLR